MNIISHYVTGTVRSYSYRNVSRLGCRNKIHCPFRMNLLRRMNIACLQWGDMSTSVRTQIPHKLFLSWWYVMAQKMSTRSPPEIWLLSCQNHNKLSRKNHSKNEDIKAYSCIVPSCNTVVLSFLELVITTWQTRKVLSLSDSSAP
jgi:hypothetical protein